MTRTQRHIIAPLAEAAAERSGREMLAWLWEAGLVDMVAAERCAIRREVARRVRSGEGRCRAMDSVAHMFGCSYEKVRAAVYDRSAAKQEEKLKQ